MRTSVLHVIAVAVFKQNLKQIRSIVAAGLQPLGAMCRMQTWCTPWASILGRSLPSASEVQACWLEGMRAAADESLGSVAGLTGQVATKSEVCTCCVGVLIWDPRRLPGVSGRRC